MRSEWDLECVIPLDSVSKHQTGPTARELTSLSADTLRRRYPELIRKVSPRRVGIKLRDALSIADGAAPKNKVE